MKRILFLFALMLSLGFAGAQFPFGQPQGQQGGSGFPQQGFPQQQGFGFPQQMPQQQGGFGFGTAPQQGFGFGQGQQQFTPPTPGFIGMPSGFEASAIALPPQFPSGAPINEMVSARMGQKIFERFGTQELISMCADEEKMAETIYDYVKSLQMPELCAPIKEGLQNCEKSIEFCNAMGQGVPSGKDGKEILQACPPDEQIMKQICIERNSEDQGRRSADFDEDVPLQCELDWERNAGNFRRMCEQRKIEKERKECRRPEFDESFRRDCGMRNGRIIDRFDQFGCVSGWECQGGESFGRETPQRAICGNNLCEYQENPDNCPGDCRLTGARCGDNFCDSGNNENSGNCRQDCLPNCGDGICAGISCMSTGCPESENSANCPNDCEIRREPGAICGNTICEAGEDYGNCASDCQAPVITEEPFVGQPASTEETEPSTTEIATSTEAATTTTETTATSAETGTATTETAATTTTTETTAPAATTEPAPEATATTSTKKRVNIYKIYMQGFGYPQPMAPQQPMQPQGFGFGMQQGFGQAQGNEANAQDFCDKDSYIRSCMGRMEEQFNQQFQETNVDRICELEAKLNKNQMARFCKQMEQGKDDCKKHAEDGCKFIEKQLGKCQEMSSEEGIKSIIEEKAHEGCLFIKMQQSQFSGFGLPFMQPQALPLDSQIFNTVSALAQSENMLTGEYAPWLSGERGRLVDVAEDVGKAEANEKSKDLIYQITKFFGMQKEKELKEAKALEKQTEKLEKTIENLKALAEQMPDESTKTALEESIKGLEERMSELQAMVQSKEAGAAGIMGIFGG